MASDLKRAADQVERFILSLEKAMNPTNGAAKLGSVRQRRADLKDKWEAYETLYLSTEIEEDAKEAAEQDHMERYERYSDALGSATDLCESTSSEAESVRGRSNSISSQGGEDATVTPERCEISVNTKEHLIGEQIKVLEGAILKENPTQEEVASWKNNYVRLRGNVEEELTQLYLNWAGADAARRDDIVNTMKTNIARLVQGLGRIDASIANKTLPVSTPPQSPSVSVFSNPLQKTPLAFKKLETPKFSGEARDYPKFKKLWKAVEEQFSEIHQLTMIQDNVPRAVESKIKTCQTMKDVWERLEDEFGRADEVGLALMDGFAKLTLSARSEHENFVLLYDKFEETLHDLKEISRGHLMKEQRSMRDLVEKMSRGIKDRYFEYSTRERLRISGRYFKPL